MLVDNVSRLVGAPKLNDGPEEAGDGVEGLAAAICANEIGAPDDVDAIGGEERMGGA